MPVKLSIVAIMLFGLALPVGVQAQSDNCRPGLHRVVTSYGSYCACAETKPQMSATEIANEEAEAKAEAKAQEEAKIQEAKVQEEARAHKMTVFSVVAVVLLIIGILALACACG